MLLMLLTLFYVDGHGDCGFHVERRFKSYGASIEVCLACEMKSQCSPSEPYCQNDGVVDGCDVDAIEFVFEVVVDDHYVDGVD